MSIQEMLIAQFVFILPLPLLVVKGKSFVIDRLIEIGLVQKIYNQFFPRINNINNFVKLKKIINFQVRLLWILFVHVVLKYII